MRKSLQLQAEMTAEFGTCVFDVTLDCEDGAPVGARPHARLVTELALARRRSRVGVRVHPVDHPPSKPTWPRSRATRAIACATS
jgi:citrate lyase subunit beta/citryl-CoA lyase